ncbi:MAG: NAD-dependent epimerase/dehydratase family protein [Candidatus Kerfeldbacteria bacterium]|nr:NAD-dependent epimerase/dehydratase family protein [Candidatus Kerfeldbacteria bacterium]
MAYKQLLDRSNVLVAGGAGFIGSHLCDELIKTHNVICVDNFITGQEENIDLLLQSPHFKFIKHDLREPLDLDKFPELELFKIKFQGVQEIYNLACPTSPKEYNRLPIETLLTNSEATRYLLDLAVKYKAKFLHVSSSAIYGEPQDGGPLKEDYWGFIDPVGPRSSYNEGKRFAESLVTNYGLHRGVSWRIARVFNTYGPRMKLDDGRMIPDFISSALQGKPLVIYGSPESTSTFCYVSDMVDGLLRLMAQEEPGIFNLGSADGKTMGEAAALVVKLCQSEVKIEVAEPLPYQARQGIPDIGKAREVLAWFPLVSLEDGLRQTVDYFRAHQGVLGVGSESRASV